MLISSGLMNEAAGTKQKSLILHEGAAQRLGEEMARELPDVELVPWNPVHGGPGEPRPDAAWITAENFLDRTIATFGEYLIGLGSVRWIQSAATGLDDTIYREILDAGIAISNCGVQAEGISEFVISEVLADFQRLDRRRKFQAERQFNRRGFRELSGSRWSLIGFGGIGQAIAKRIKPFGCEVVAVRQSGRESELAEAILEPADLHRAVGGADVVVLACPLTEETSSLANDAFFNSLKDGTVFVNVSRGKVVDEEALLRALETDSLRTAILDVFAEEPLPTSSPFWDHPKVRVSAHIAGFGHLTLPRSDAFFLENTKRFFAGETPLNLASK